MLPNSLKSALVPWLARIPVRVGYAAKAARRCSTGASPNPAGRPPMVAFYGALAGASVRRDDGDRACTSSRAAARCGARRGTASQRGAYWTFAPGAEYGPAKRWPAAHYAALARSLHDADGAPIALLGSPGEAALCEEIAAAGAAAPAASSPAARRCSTRWR